MLKALLASLFGAVLIGGGTPAPVAVHLSSMARLHEATLWQVAPAALPATVMAAVEVSVDQVQARASGTANASASALPPALPAVATTVVVHAPRVAAPPPPAPVCGVGCFHALAPQTVRVIVSATHPARMGNGITLIPIGSSVVVIGYVDNCNGRWYELSDHVSWVHESALAGVVAPSAVSC